MTKFILEIRNQDGFSDIVGLYICQYRYLYLSLTSITRRYVPDQIKVQVYMFVFVSYSILNPCFITTSKILLVIILCFMH